MSISESSWTRMLKELRIKRRLTHLRTIKLTPTTKLISPKSLTATLTGHNRPMTLRHTMLKGSRTRGKQIHAATYDRTNTFAFMWGHC